MARGFRRKGSGRQARYVAQLDPLERATVAGLMDQVCELLDVASNALGAVLGVVAASVVGRRRHGGNRAADDQAGVGEPGDERRDVGGDHLGG